MTAQLLDQFQGCLLGGAIGDALGYPIEFFLLDEIVHQYGPKGVSNYVLLDGIAQISDDTQMTLFTANALLCAQVKGNNRLSNEMLLNMTAACYQDWLRTQYESYPLNDKNFISWLMHVPELFHQRAPGNTCLSSIAQGAQGSIDNPINQSKGCGGIMRVAPIGLYLSIPEQAGLAAAQNAAMTHGHELGYIPAGVLGYCISAIVHKHSTSLLDAIQGAMTWATRQFSHAQHLQELNDLVEQAIQLAQEQQEDIVAIQSLGEGWVAEETLAIALYCCLRYEHEFERALLAAVNHDGDSDSTGAVTGNLLGAIQGFSGIPSKHLENLELKSVILTLATDLYHSYCFCSDAQIPNISSWQDKYRL